MHTVNATYENGIYTYFLNGGEFLRTIDRYTHATVYTRPNVGGGESVWVFPTKTNRQSHRKTLERQGADFWGVVKIAGIFPN